MELDDLGFLGGDIDADRLAEALDALRPALCIWAAQTIVARHPELRRFRGVKGRRAWEQDLDFLMRRLHAAVAGEAAGLGASTMWLERTLAGRGIDRAATLLAIAVAQEALLRLAGAEDGARLATQLGEAVAHTPPPRLAAWLAA